MRKTILMLLAVLLIASATMAATPRIALLDFEDETGAQAGAFLVGGTTSEGLAAKGAHLLARQVVASDFFTLVDRRDFTSQLDQEFLGIEEEFRPRVSFLHAAQMLRVDAVLAGSLLSFSTSTESVNRGSNNVEFTNLSLRVAVRALDAVDGSILAMGEAVARKKVRQSGSTTVSWGEDEMLALMGEAINDAANEMVPQLETRLAKRQERERANISILATEDPALVELDGMLVGSTPMENLQVYVGDHILRVSRPGFRTITKRFLITGDVKITTPMFRTELTALEQKEMVEKLNMEIFLTNGEPDFWIQEFK